MSQFRIVHLGGEQIADCYPLVRTAAPEVSAERWQDFAEAAIRGTGGILGAYAGNLALHGVAVFRPDSCLHGGRSLRVDPMVTLELDGSAPVRAALCEALELIAMARDCGKLVLSLNSRGYADPAGRKALGWLKLGMDLEAVTFAKTLSHEPAEPGMVSPLRRR
jgi:hypothetical protein